MDNISSTDIIGMILLPDVTQDRSLAPIMEAAHHAQQKIFATILHAGLIDRLLAQPEIDRAALKGLAQKIRQVGYATARAVEQVQTLAAAHDKLGGLAIPPCDRHLMWRHRPEERDGAAIEAVDARAAVRQAGDGSGSVTCPSHDGSCSRNAASG